MTENTVPEYCLGGNSQFLESDVEVVARDTQALLKKWRVRKKNTQAAMKPIKYSFV